MAKSSRRVAALAVTIAAFLAPADAVAQDVDIGKVRVVVPSVVGKSRWGTRKMTRELRRSLREDVQLVSQAALLAAAKKLKIPRNRRGSLENLARAAKAAGIHYVLRVRITKRGWLFTARALLVNSATAKIDMDFRSDFYKPKTEAKDRGTRIARKTEEKLAILLADGGLPKLAGNTPSDTAPVGATGPKSEPTGDKTGGDVTTGDQTSGDKTTTTTEPSDSGDTPASDATDAPDASDTSATSESSDSSGETTTTDTDSLPEVAVGGDSLESADIGGDDLGGDDLGGEFSDDFASEFGGGGDGADGGGELDGFSDEGGWNWQVGGWIGTKYFAFFDSDLSSDKGRNFVKTGLRTTVTGKLGSDARIRVLSRIELDATNQRLHRVIIEESFLEYALESVEFRLGWDTLTWGSASAVHVVDIINARDYSEGVTDAPKVGQPMASARFLFGNHSLALLYLAPFVAPLLPRGDTPFSPFEAAPGTDAGDRFGSAGTLYASSLNEWHPQAAARAEFAFSGLDVRGSYFYGYGRFPFVHAPTGVLFFPLLHNISTDFQLLLKGTSIKVEVAHVRFIDTDISRRPPLTLTNGLPAAPIAIPDPRFTWVIGIEHTFENFIGGTTLTPVAEFIGDTDSPWFTDDRPPDDLTRFFENHLAFGAQWSFNNDVDGQLVLLDLMDLRNPTDHLITVEYKERWFQNFTFVLGGRLGVAQEGNKGAAYEQLTGLYTELRLNY